MSAWVLWLIIVIGNVRVLLFACAMAPFIIFIISMGATAINCAVGKEAECLTKVACWWKKYVIPWTIIVFLAAMCPTTRQAAAICVLPKLVDAAQVSEIPEALESLAVEWCKKQVVDLTSEIKTETKP